MAIAAIALGLVLRFAHLDRKVYWHDEVYTSLRVAGYSGSRVAEAVVDRPDLTAADLLRYQQMPAQPSLADTWQALANNPEHPPLYYLLAHGWGRLFGASVSGYRAIAAIFGAIALPTVFWLTRQLFPTQPFVAWVATALFTLSPVQLIYSQEAREYSLWTIGLLLAHGTLVRALRQGTYAAWGSYGLALGFAWYGSLVTGLLGLSHGVFMVLTQRQRQPWTGFLLAHGLSLALFAPWIWTIIQRWERLREVTAWTNMPKPFSLLASLWGLHYSAALFDLNLPLNHPFTVVGPLVGLGLLAVALGHLVRYYPRPTVLLLACGLLVPPLVLIGSDLLRSGQITSNTRYFLPSLVLVPVAIAPLIHDLISAKVSPLARNWRQALGVGLLGLLLGLGLVSGGVNSSALTWWNKSLGYHNRFIADYLNQISAPVVVVDNSGIALGEAISLSYYLRPETPLWLLPDPVLPSSATLRDMLQRRPGSSLFLLKPSGDLLATLPPRWQSAPVDTATEFAPSHLVQLIPPVDA